MSLSLIKSWVFDLDNTLYDPEEDIFSQIDKKMTSFISKRFDINTNDAFNIQKEYFLEYGTTLAGLMNDKNSNIDPDEFLEYVHNIDLKSLNPNLELKKAITNHKIYAIQLVHIYGYPARDTEKIIKLCKNYGMLIAVYCELYY